MDLYQHDSPSTLRFVLRGSLEGRWVREFQQAWVTATSILKGREIVIDVSGMTGIDDNGLKLLSRIRDAGGRLSARALPELPGLAGVLGVAPGQSVANGKLNRRIFLSRWISRRSTLQ
jgi:hypothetical protein